MTTIKLTDSDTQLSETVDAAQGHGERTILERGGKPAAAVVSIEDLELLRQIEDAHDLELARQARAEGGPAVPLEEVKAEFGVD